MFLGGVNPFNITNRFLAFGCLGQIIGSAALNWLDNFDTTITSKNVNSEYISHYYVTTFHQTVLTLLIISYLLFMWLWTSVHKEERKMQIIQLKGAINGLFKFFYF